MVYRRVRDVIIRNSVRVDVAFERLTIYYGRLEMIVYNEVL